MAGQSCYNCIYAVCDPELWLRAEYMGEPLLMRCANHPWWPGEMHEVPGSACRNYRPKPKEPKGNVRPIPLGNGIYTYVDAADYEWLSRYTWQLVGGGYAGRREGRKLIYMHREIMQPGPGMVVDHKSRNRLDNSRDNLRVCTRQENLRNMSKRRGCTSRFKGVYYNKLTHKWIACIRIGAKNFALGSFDVEEEAARAYDRKAVEVYGEFARPNFPEEWPPERTGGSLREEV